MTDEALRALERDARARPDDRAAAWVYARGLERAGERRALWLELCRLARAGDEDAGRAVDAWVPGLGGTKPPVLASLRAPKVERVSLVRDEAFRNDRVRTEVVSAPDGNLLLLAGQTLVAVDPKAESVVWRQERVAALKGCGDDALIVTRERSAFLRRGGGSELVAGAGLIGHGAVDSAVMSGDRLVVQSAVLPAQLLQAFDLGEALFGHVLWTHGGCGAPSLAGDVTLLVGDDMIEARDVESGRSLWEVPYRDGLRPSWWDHDRAGAVLHTWLDEGAQTIALESGNGAERWSATHALSSDCATLTPALVVIDHGNEHVCAYSRDDGQLQWTQESKLLHLNVAYATGADTLYAAAVHGPMLWLTVLDLITGAVRTTAQARLPSGAADGDAWPMWVRDGTVEVLVTTRTDLVVIVRFAD